MMDLVQMGKHDFYVKMSWS